MDLSSTASGNDSNDHIKCEDLGKLIAYNAAYAEVLDNVIFKFEEALRENQRKQQCIIEEKRALKANDVAKKKVPVNQYLPPYFKDDCGMCPPMSNEAKQKLSLKWFDPLLKEEKKMTASELKTLHQAIKEHLINNQVEPLRNKRDLLVGKLKATNVNTTPAERRRLTIELTEVIRRIAYFTEQNDEDVITPNADYSNIRWNEISSLYYKGTRSEHSLRAKWMNELSPKWNKSPWTKQELDQVKELRESQSFISWPMLAIELNTNRPPFQCFEKYKSEIMQSSREWTQEEDEKLITLTKVLSINKKVQWDKVAQYMPGRSRQQVRTRFSHTLDSQVKHGRWSDQEDMLLMCSVSRSGAKDWGKIAQAIPGRNDSQCRERWVNVLNKPLSQAERFSLEDDEKLLFAVKVFGKGSWAKCTSILPNRTGRQLRKRYIQLISAKLKLINGQTDALDMMKTKEELEDPEYEASDSKTNPRLLQIFNRLTEIGPCEDASCDSLLERVNATMLLERYHRHKKSANWPVIQQNLKEISERHKNLNEPISANDILTKLEITDNDVRYMLEHSDRDNLLARSREKARRGNVDEQGSERVRPVREVIVEPLPIFHAEVTEEERVMTTVEALCSVVRKHDAHIWSSMYKRNYRLPASNQVEQFVQKMLTSSAEQVVQSKSTNMYLPPWSTLAPTFASCGLSHALDQCRGPLTQAASKYFYPVGLPVRNQEEFSSEKRTALTKEDRLNITLASDISNSNEYMLFEARMRALLLEPYRLNSAIETRESEHRRLTRIMQVEERQAEEESVRNESLQYLRPEVVDDPPEIKNFLENGISINNDLLKDATYREESRTKQKHGRISKIVDEVVDKCRKRAATPAGIEESGAPVEEDEQLVEAKTPRKEEPAKKRKKRATPKSRSRRTPPARMAKDVASSRMKMPTPGDDVDDARSSSSSSIDSSDDE